MTDIYDLAGEPRPKFCINCKHIGRNGSGDASRYRCFAVQNIAGKETDLVTGQSYTNFRFDSCYEARLASAERCGLEGKWFEPAPQQAQEPSQSTTRKLSADELLSQLERLK